MAWCLLFPDLEPWITEEDRNEEIDDVENGVDDYEYHSKVIGYVTLDGAEYSEDEEEDGELGEQEGEAVNCIINVRVLGFVRSVCALLSLWESYAVGIFDIRHMDIPLMFPSAMIGDGQVQR